MCLGVIVLGNAIGNSITSRMNYNQQQERADANEAVRLRAMKNFRSQALDGIEAEQRASEFESVRLRAMASYRSNALDDMATDAEFDALTARMTASDRRSDTVLVENAQAQVVASDRIGAMRASAFDSVDPLTGRSFAWASPAPGPDWWYGVKETPYFGATLRTAIGLGGSYASAMSEFGSLVSDGYNYLAGNNRSVITGEFSADSGLVNSIQSRGWAQTGADMLHGLASAPVEFFASVGRADYEHAGAGLGFYVTLGLGAIGTEARVAGSLGRTEQLTYDISKWGEHGLPSDGTFARTLTPAQYKDFQAGRSFNFGGTPVEGYPNGMGFIGSAEEVRGITTRAGYDKALKLGYQPRYVLEFQLKDPAGLQNVIKAPYPEFKYGGQTGAGFKEWNYPGINSNNIVNPRVRVLK